MVDENSALVSSNNSGSPYLAKVLSTIDREQLKPNRSVALHKVSMAVVDVLPSETDSSISMMQVTEKPDVTYKDIGNCDIQKQEMREAIELPLSMPELYS